jgi:ribosomal protein S18 acetylase RimI-like enzyme
MLYCGVKGAMTPDKRLQRTARPVNRIVGPHEDRSVPPLQYRLATAADAAACVELRGKTRENAVSIEGLASLGITVELWRNEIASGLHIGRVCLDGGNIVGYCFGDTSAGEILVLALLPRYERRGIGKLLLSQVMRDLRNCGHKRLVLGCSADPSHRSYGFYRHLGWRSTGTFDGRGDEVLEYDC